MKKRGLSPLIATLLLISFAVALGVVIMTFGQAQVENEAQCSINIGLKFSKIGGKEQFCLDQPQDELFFVVENGVNINIAGLAVNVIGNKKALSYDLSDAKIAKAGSYLKRVPYKVKDVGKLRQIKIIPKITLYDEEIICQEKAIILEEVKDC